MSTHNISFATQQFAGNAYYPPYVGTFENTTHRGLQVDLPIYQSLGAIKVADIDTLIKAATSTELPDTETVTYTFPGTGSPQDGLNNDGIIGVVADRMGRNITVNTAHSSSVVAMTIVVTGTDIYGDVMSETIAVAATGTTQVDAGQKAFFSVTTIDLIAVADAEANTVNIGFGDIIGLPFRITDKNAIVVRFDGGIDAATIVVADDTAATATTDDVRGTIDAAGTLDGTKLLAVEFLSPFRDTKIKAFGIDNFAG